MLVYDILVAFGLIAYSHAFFRLSCPGRVTRERLDPIVSPDAVSRHVHTVSGGSGFKALTTYEDTQISPCSSCSIKEDMSNYWTPQLYVKYKDGSGFAPVPVVGEGDDAKGGMTVYYMQRRGSNPTEKLYAFPNGFRMVAGDPFARSCDGSLAAEAVSFACVGSNTAQSNGIPNIPCPDGLRAQIFFPKCWDGKNVDSVDHRSHMSYPDGNLYDNGDCPPSHPFHTASMFFEVFYDTARFNDEWVNGTHPFIFSQGDATGYGFHGDFFNGWDVDVLQTAIDTCTDEFGVVEKCPVFTLFTNDECKNCKLPTSVQERVDGRLASLPGCNPITYGPERATVGNCSGETALFGDGPKNYADLTQKQKWEYVGCGTDSVSDRAMNGKVIRNNHMTVDMCVYYCNFFGYTYAALENGNECFCNTELNMKHAPKQGFMGSCSKPCPGNSRQVCGGVNAMSIYHRCTRTSCKNKEFSIVASVDSQEADLQLNTTYFDLGVAAANGNYDCFCNAFTLPPPTLG